MAQRRNYDPDRRKGYDKGIYWAKLPIDELAPILMDKIDDFYDELSSNGMLALWRASYKAYYGLSDDGGQHAMSRVDIGGDGEVIYARAAHFSNLIKHLLVILTANKIHFQPSAANNDNKTHQQVFAAKSILEHYETKPEEMNKYRAMALRALLFGQGYLWTDWDNHKGKPYAADTDKDGNPTGAMLYEGDIKTAVLGPLEVIRDLTLPTDKSQWYIVRLRGMNKYDLAALYADQAELAEAIVDITCDDDDDEMILPGSFGQSDQRDDADHISMYIFYHPKTPAMPDGRKAVVLTGDVWLSDEPLPLEEVTISRMVPDEFIDTPHGYSVAWDLISLHELHNACLSAAVTAFDQGSMSNVALQEGTEITDEELSAGGRIVRLPPGVPEPKPFNLLDPRIIQTSETLRAWLRGDMETISGINSVHRGEIPANIKSGSMAALVEAQALAFHSGLDAAFTLAVRTHAMHQLQLFKAYATTERVIRMVGQEHQSAAEFMTNRDVEEIQWIDIDRGNPIERALGGQMDMAETLLKNGALTRPKEFLEIRRTGRLDSVTYPDDVIKDAIKAENDRLRQEQLQIQSIQSPLRGAPPGPDGQPQQMPRKVIAEVPALPFDMHPEHIRMHIAEISDPIRRNDQERIRLFLTHIQDHLYQWRNADPDLLMAIGLPPLGMAPPPGPGAPGAPPSPPFPGGPGGPGGPQKPGKPESSKMPEAMGPPPPNSAMSKTNQPVKMPSMPKSPMTRQ